jgi:hypothetical protein
MIETPEKPVSQIVITFGGADGMSPGLRADNVNPAQWACAIQLATLMAQLAWSQAMAQAQSQGLVRAPAGALGVLDKQGRSGRSGLGNG